MLNWGGRLSKVYLEFHHLFGLAHLCHCLGLGEVDRLLFVGGLRFEEVYLDGPLLLVQCLEILGGQVLREHFHALEKIGRCWLGFWASIRAVVFDRPVSHLVGCCGRFPTQILAYHPKRSMLAQMLACRGGVPALFAQRIAQGLYLGGCQVGCPVALCLLGQQVRFPSQCKAAQPRRSTQFPTVGLYRRVCPMSVPFGAYLRANRWKGLFVPWCIPRANIDSRFGAKALCF